MYVKIKLLITLSLTNKCNKTTQKFITRIMKSGFQQTCTKQHYVTVLIAEDKKLSCRREAARCFVFVSSQLQHTYSAVFFITGYCGFRFTSHKILLNSILLSPIVSGGV